jgi:WD40 repeat protein
VLGLSWSKDSRRFYTNTRLYLSPCGESEIPAASLTDRPDLDNTLEIQEWAIEGNVLVSRMKGAHGFTTKDCPFYLFLSESPCGDYIASGSEDCGVYVYNVRHRRLMRVLWSGHQDVVSMVSWSPASVLATASDDKKICLWGSAMHSRSDKADVQRRGEKRRRTVSRSG